MNFKIEKKELQISHSRRSQFLWAAEQFWKWTSKSGSHYIITNKAHGEDISLTARMPVLSGVQKMVSLHPHFTICPDPFQLYVNPTRMLRPKRQKHEKALFGTAAQPQTVTRFEHEKSSFTLNSALLQKLATSSNVNKGEQPPKLQPVCK